MNLVLLSTTGMILTLVAGIFVILVLVELWRLPRSQPGITHVPFLGALPAIFSHYPYLYDWATSVLEVGGTPASIHQGEAMSVVLLPNDPH